MYILRISTWAEALRRLTMFAFFLFLFSSCHVGRFFWWNFADLNDYKKFPYQVADISDDPSPLFRGKEFPFSVPAKYQKQEAQQLSLFLEQNSTVCFLVLRNDTLIYERYFNRFHKESIIPSFSVSKVFVSALTGIALREGHIRDVADPVTNYLTFLSDDNFHEITLEHLLNMRSGIAFNERYFTPFADIPRYYYGRNLKKYIGKMKVAKTPGSEYHYASVNTLLLSLAIEKATGQSITEYLETRIWKPLGMEHHATWSIDSERHNTVKSFCCLNAIALDFVRFGNLYLHGGKWGKDQIIPEEWIKQSLSVTADSKDSQGYPYSYCWRVDGDTGYFAKGILGQYIMVFPSANIVVVRMGRKTAGIDWYDFTRELLKQLD